MNKRRALLITGLILVSCFALFRPYLTPLTAPLKRFIFSAKTVEDQIAFYGPRVRKRVESDFKQKNVTFPPTHLTLLCLKKERVLQIYAMQRTNWVFVRDYPILGASGGPGPKLAEGDLQVPEGIYRVDSLNPNSQNHLAIRLNYPNEFDREQAQVDNRKRLGGDIMIHGGADSIGCLAIGDAPSEDIFVLVHATGLTNTTVIISPVDLRREEGPKASLMPPWASLLYKKIRQAISNLPQP